MSLKEQVLGQCENAKEAAIALQSINEDAKNFVLFELAEDIKRQQHKIIEANKKDLKENKKKISEVMLKRLKIDEKKIEEMVENVLSVAKLEDPVGHITSHMELEKDLTLKKMTVPIGVLCCIFESRPEVVIQISALAIKSGNAVLLKGGSEAHNSNAILTEIVRDSIKDNKGMPEDAIQLLETREHIKEILKMDDFIDLLIPRGSNELVKHIQNNTRIPVLGHAEGICHVFIDKDADIKKAHDITLDAKTQYAAVCNALENLVVHKSIADKFIPSIVKTFLKAGVEVRLGTKALNAVKKDKSIPLKDIKTASEKDFKTEYTDMILSIKVVDDEKEAIEFINKHGSGHTDAIVTENNDTAKKFMTLVDSSSVMHNASTRFADGFRYGLGAEVGISTNKIHARGPVGLDGLVITKFILEGKGHIVDDFEKGKKKFSHKKIK